MYCYMYYVLQFESYQFFNLNDHFWSRNEQFQIFHAYISIHIVSGKISNVELGQ